jgi:hypothetical protein
MVETLNVLRELVGNLTSLVFVLLFAWLILKERRETKAAPPKLSKRAAHAASKGTKRLNGKLPPSAAVCDVRVKPSRVSPAS